MKSVIQRVSEARVEIGGNTAAEIGKGMLVFIGIEKGDTENDVEYLVKKISNLRIFEDVNNKMNLSIKDIHGEVLVVSQFTLSAECKKGNRPSFDRSEEPAKASGMYINFVNKLRAHGLKVCTGDFGSFMKVYLLNDGPVTILLDTKRA